MRIAAGLAALLALAACGESGGARAAASTAPEAPPPAPAPAAAPAGCADRLEAEIDAASFAVPGAMPAQPALAALRGEAARAVRRVAGAMCADGSLPAGALRPFRRLLVQQADGADNAAFWSGEGTPAPGDLVFQAVFHRGAGAGPALAMPGDRDLREGLLCWHDFEGNRAMCEERLP